MEEKMLLALNGATTMKADLPTDIRVAGAAGFDLVELWAAKLDTYLAKHRADDLVKLLLTNRVSPYSINSIEQITFRDAAGRAEVNRRCHQLCEIARAIHCPYLVVVPSDKPTPTITWPEIVAESVKVLRELSLIASEYSIGLAFEFIGDSKRSVATLGQCWEIVQKTDRPNVGLVIDTFHFYAGGSTLEQLKAIDPARLFIFHINDVEPRPKAELTDAHRLFPGLGVIPLKEMIATLRGIGYDRMASVEIFRPEYWEWDPLRVAKEARAATLKVLGG